MSCKLVTKQKIVENCPYLTKESGLLFPLSLAYFDMRSLWVLAPSLVRIAPVWPCSRM